MNDIVAVFAGLFFCLIWPALWVSVAVYVMRYRSPVAWRGLGVRRDDIDED